MWDYPPSLTQAKQIICKQAFYQVLRFVYNHASKPNRYSLKKLGIFSLLLVGFDDICLTLRYNRHTISKASAVLGIC